MIRFVQFPACLIAVSVVAAAPASSAEREVLTLPRASTWGLSIDAESCALSREFGSPGKTVAMSIRKFDPGSQMTVYVTSKDIPVASLRFKSAAFENTDAVFLPEIEKDSSPTSAFAKSDAAFLEANDGEKGFLFLASFLPQVRPALPDGSSGSTSKESPVEVEKIQYTSEQLEARLKSITGLLVTNGFESDIVLETGSMFAPMNAMQACIDNLVQSWGLEPMTQRNLSKPAEMIERQSTLQQFVRQIRFPTTMLVRKESARMQMRMDVDEAGNPTGCHAPEMLGDAVLKTQACDSAMHLFRFEPALDKDGNPVASYYIAPVIFRVRG